MKLYRLTAICLLSSAIIWFGLEFGPSHRTAEAKVFERLFSFTEAMPDYLFDDDATSKPRKVIFNGNTTWLTVTKTRDDIDEVLKFYFDQHQPQPTIFDAPDEIVDQIEDQEIRDLVLELNKSFKRREKKQPFMLIRENYGFLGMIDFHNKELEIGSKSFVEKVEEITENGRFGELAIGRVVIAMRNKNSRQTTVVNIWTDRDFNLNNLKKDDFGEVPGFDIEDVPLYHTNKRVLSLEQDNPLALYRVTQYKGEGSQAAHIIFLHSRMASNGWKTDSVFDEVTHSSNNENIMFYTKDNRECTIQVNRDATQQMIETTIIENTLKL